VENSVGRDDSVWKKVWEVVKFLLLFVPVLLFVLLRRRDISDTGGVQSDTASSGAIRDGIESVTDGVEASKKLVDRSTDGIDSSIQHTENAIGAIQRARDILDKAKQRTAKDNK
jgi:hypothetical protein